jgi:hypothetical protein
VLLGGKSLAELSAAASPSEPAQTAAEQLSPVQAERKHDGSGDAAEAAD